MFGVVFVNLEVCEYIVVIVVGCKVDEQCVVVIKCMSDEMKVVEGWFCDNVGMLFVESFVELVFIVELFEVVVVVVFWSCWVGLGKNEVWCMSVMLVVVVCVLCFFVSDSFFVFMVVKVVIFIVMIGGCLQYFFDVFDVVFECLCCFGYCYVMIYVCFDVLF